MNVAKRARLIIWMGIFVCALGIVQCGAAYFLWQKVASLPAAEELDISKIKDVLAASSLPQEHQDFLVRVIQERQTYNIQLQKTLINTTRWWRDLALNEMTAWIVCTIAFGGILINRRNAAK